MVKSGAGEGQVTTSEVDLAFHEDIVNKAVQLAKVATEPERAAADVQILKQI